jgi:predicted nucleic acid-binding protein
MQPECGKVCGQTLANLEKRGLPIGNNYLWIAAQAMAAELPLVAGKTKEF